MQLSALVVVGDGNGRVGVGMGKSAEVPTAIKTGPRRDREHRGAPSKEQVARLPRTSARAQAGAGRV